MSYILDALKKADRDRSLGEVPDLEAAHWGLRRSDSAPRRWLWIVAVLLVVNAGLLTWMLGRDHADTASPGPEEITHIASPRAQAPVEVIAPERTDEPAGQPDRQLTVVRPKVAVIPHIPQRAPVAPAAPAAAGQQSSPRVVQAQVPLSGAAVEGAAEVPELSELPLEFRSGFQAPRIDVHVYAEEPRRRFVLVELQKFREGDTLQNGAVLEKISPNSIQLYYQGTRFRVDR